MESWRNYVGPTYVLASGLAVLLKLDGLIPWGWGWVLAPIWVPLLLSVFLFVLAAIFDVISVGVVGVRRTWRSLKSSRRR